MAAVERGNSAGILAMLVSMACFTSNDTLLKLASLSLPLGELIFLRNTVATLLVIALLVATTGFAPPRGASARLVGWRLVGEVGATLLYLSALVRMPIADVTAIGQFTPLAITAAAAIVLGEPVGWRRWLAAGVGLIGVMLIIRPGSSAFSLGGVLALASLSFVVLRDLATRRIPVVVPTLLITAVSSAAVLAASLTFAPFESWRWPSGGEMAFMTASGVFLVGGYVFIIVAMRAGEVAVVSPFRYSVIVFALLSGLAVWGEVPDWASLVGVAIVIGAGVYTFRREHALRRDRPAVEAKPASG